MVHQPSAFKVFLDNKVLVADVQLIIASMSFGFGFAGQKEGMVEGVGPLTFNALRYMISTVMLAIWTLVMPMITGNNSSSSRAAHDKDDNSLGDLISKSLSASLENESGTNSVVVSNSNLTLNNKNSSTINSQKTNNSNSKERVFEVMEKSQREFNATMSIWFYGFALAFLNFSGSTLQQTGIQYTTSSESAFLTGFYIVFTPMLQVLIPSISAGPKPKWNTWLAVSLAMLGLFIISESQSAADKTEMDVNVNR